MFVLLTRGSSFAPLKNHALIYTTDLLLYVMHAHGSCTDYFSPEVVHLCLNLITDWFLGFRCGSHLLLLRLCSETHHPSSICGSNYLIIPRWTHATTTNRGDTLTHGLEIKITSYIVHIDKTPFTCRAQLPQEWPGYVFTDLLHVSWRIHSFRCTQTSEEEVPTPVIELDRQKAEVNFSLQVVDVFGLNC